MNVSEDPSKPTGSAPEVAAGQRPAVSGSRRRLLRGGLAAAPALLALKSTPVMACNCKAPSGFSASGNLSHNVARCDAPSGTPSNWQGKCGNSNPWAYGTTGCKRDDKFTSCSFSKSASYPDDTLGTCLGKGNTNHQALAVACYLQACIYGGAGFPTKSMIQTLWNAGICPTTSTFRPNASSPVWSKTQCVNYLLYLSGQA